MEQHILLYRLGSNYHACPSIISGNLLTNLCQYTAPS